MKLCRSLLLALAAPAVALAACGGAPPPPSPPAAPAPAAAPPPAAAPAPAPSAAAASTKTAADHHRDFMAGCAKKAVNSPDYCECAWGEFRKAFTEDEMAAGDLPPPKLEKVKGQVLGACASTPREIPAASARLWKSEAQASKIISPDAVGGMIDAAAAGVAAGAEGGA